MEDVYANWLQFDSNAAIAGDVRITNGSSVANHTGNGAMRRGRTSRSIPMRSIDRCDRSPTAARPPNAADGDAYGNYVDIDANTIQGDVTIANRDATAQAAGAGTVGDAYGHYNNVGDNPLIGGDLTVTSGRGTATSADGDAYGNKTNINDNTQIDGDIRVRTGTASASVGTDGEARGNRVYVYNVAVGGRIDIVNGNATAQGTSGGYAYGNFASVYGRATTTIGGDVRITNGHARTDATYESWANLAYVTNNVSIDGDVRITNRNAVATSAESSTYGNYAYVAYNGTITGDIVVNNGRARTNNTGGSSDSTANESYLYENTDIQGDVLISHGRARSSAFDGDSYAQRANVYENAIDGDLSIALQDATATSTGGDAYGNYTYVGHSTTVDGDVSISNRNATAVAGGTANDIFTDLDDVTIGGNLRISSGGRGEDAVELDDVDVVGRTDVITHLDNDKITIRDSVLRQSGPPQRRRRYGRVRRRWRQHVPRWLPALGGD